MIVAIDGPAGSGKSTIAKMLATKFNLFNLNSGEFYRAFALWHLNKKRDIESKEDIEKSLKDIDLTLVGDDLCLGGKKVDVALLHTAEIDHATSVISVNIPVRLKINEILQQSTKGRNIVCEGRDITSVVFPNAEVKIYLDADPNERSKRRATERGENVEEVKSEIIKRDERDINKPFGGLKKVEGATIIDTTHLTILDVCEKISRIVEVCL